MRKTEKAMDVFNKTNFFFVDKAPFEKAFPEIKKMVIEVIEKGYGIHYKSSRKYTEKDPPGEFVNCSNDLCYNGGFSIGEILRETVRDKKTHKKTLKMCQGYEGSSKGRRKYRSCINSFNLEVNLEFK